MVVMGVVGLLVVMSIPALGSYATQMRLKTATREVVGLLSLARSLAVSSRIPRTVVIDPEQHRLILEEPENSQQEVRVRSIPKGVDVEVITQGEPADGASRLTFQSSGALAGRFATINLSNGAKTVTVTVTAATGAVLVD